MTSRILSGLSPLSLPTLRPVFLAGTSRDCKILVRALGGASRTADEDAPVLLQTPLSRLLSSLGLILARFLAFLRCLARRVSRSSHSHLSREHSESPLDTSVLPQPFPSPLPAFDALTRCLYSLMASTLTLPIFSLDSHSTNYITQSGYIASGRFASRVVLRYPTNVGPKSQSVDLGAIAFAEMPPTIILEPSELDTANCPLFTNIRITSHVYYSFLPYSITLRPLLFLAEALDTFALASREAKKA